MLFRRSCFCEIGKNVVFHPTNSDLDYTHISIGDNVFIGSNARMWATESHIYLSHHISIAPNVSIIAGNHNYKKIGKWITDYTKQDKSPEDDKAVYIDSDVWIGTNVTILNGVHIGRGCIVAAGSVVNKSIPPYSIIGGVPARVLKYRFSVSEVLEHEKALYPDSLRLTKNQVEDTRANL